MLYEIQFPAAEPMVDAERAEKRIALEHYRDETVAYHVAQDILRTYWNESGGDQAVEVVMAAIRAMGNTREFQRAIVRELWLRSGRERLLRSRWAISD